MDYGRPINLPPLPGTADFHKARARIRKKSRQGSSLTLEDLKTAYAVTMSEYSAERIHSELVRTLRDIRKGSYRPGKCITKQIAKPAGGFRALEIPTLVDRAVSRACLDSINTDLERQFDNRSHGGRKGHGIITALADACKAATVGLRFVVCADIYKAFDHTPLEQALDCLGMMIPGHPNLELIKSIVRGHLGASKKIGLRQGDNLSPAVFNSFMHYWVDSTIEQSSSSSYLRYLDNIYVFSSQPGEGAQILESVKAKLDSLGMTLGIDAVVRLNNCEKVGILGFQLGVTGDRIEITGSEKSWSQLEATITKAFDKPNPQKSGLQGVRGWLTSQGLRDSWSTEDTDRVKGIIKNHGLDFKISHEEAAKITVPTRKELERLLRA